jgi:hypothetical protein
VELLELEIELIKARHSPDMDLHELARPFVSTDTDQKKSAVRRAWHATIWLWWESLMPERRTRGAADPIIELPLSVAELILESAKQGQRKGTGPGRSRSSLGHTARQQFIIILARELKMELRDEEGMRRQAQTAQKTEPPKKRVISPETGSG